VLDYLIRTRGGGGGGGGGGAGSGGSGGGGSKTVLIGHSIGTDICLHAMYTLGRAVQVDPTKHTLKAPGPKYLKPEYDKLLLNSMCAATGGHGADIARGGADALRAEERGQPVAALSIRARARAALRARGMGLHSSTSQLILSRF